METIVLYGLGFTVYQVRQWYQDVLFALQLGLWYACSAACQYFEPALLSEFQTIHVGLSQNYLWFSETRCSYWGPDGKDCSM